MAVKIKSDIVAKVPGVDPRQQYVSSWIRPILSQLLNALPKYVDDLERDYGSQTYERMLWDSAVGGAVDTLRDMAMDAGLTVLPAIEPPQRGETNPDYDRAVDICEFVKEAIADMDCQLEEAVYEMLLAIPFGSQVAEVVLKDVPGDKLYLRHLAVRPRANLQPVLDEEMNLIGYHTKRVGENWMLDTTIVPPEWVFPREKFAVLTYKPRNGDPRGTSGIRRAYNAWWIKTTVWPDFMRFLSQFGSPSLAVFTPPDSQDQIEFTDPKTGLVKTTTPEEAAKECVEAFFKGSSVLSLRGGSILQLIQSTGNGEAFQVGIDILDREITRGILLQTRATMEALHGSKADSSTSKDILDMVVRRIQNWASNMLRRDVFRLIVRLNFGDDAVRFTPFAKLSGVDRPDLAPLMTATAALFTSGYIANDQLPEIDDMLGFPQRDMDAWEANQAAEADLKRQQAADMSRLINPTADDEPPTGNKKGAKPPDTNKSKAKDVPEPHPIDGVA
jgi:hypothetical protein